MFKLYSKYQVARSGFFRVINIGANSEPIIEDWWQEIVDKFTVQKDIFKKDVIIEFK